MSARAGAFGDLARYNLQRCFAEPMHVFVGGDVNYHRKLLALIPAVKHSDGRQVSSQSALTVLQIGQRRGVLDSECSSMNNALLRKIKLIVRCLSSLILSFSLRNYLFIFDQRSDSSRLQHKGENMY